MTKRNGQGALVVVNIFLQVAKQIALGRLCFGVVMSGSGHWTKPLSRYFSAAFGDD